MAGMAQDDTASYGDRIAAVYDTWYKLPDPEPEASLLADLAEGGRVLELGVGTGRIAIPLAAKGVEVHGIDASAKIVDQMRAKPGGASIAVTIGDMADVPVDGEFSLVFVVFNTLFMLTTQEAQVRCFRNVAAHLRPGGRFLVHAFVPDTSRYTQDQALSVRDVAADSVRLDASIYDPQAQQVASTQIHIAEDGIQLVHAKLRFAYPPELDLMAQLAGLSLEDRWGSFGREPFTADSAFHVSVYRKR
jgi:SAM-dependent methyltransferase